MFLRSDEPGTAQYTEQMAVNARFISRYNSANAERMLGNCMICKKIGHYMHFCMEHPEDTPIKERLFIIYKTYPSNRPINPNLVAALVGQTSERGQAASTGQWHRQEIRSWYSEELIPIPGVIYDPPKAPMRIIEGPMRYAILMVAQEEWRFLSANEVRALRQLVNRSVLGPGFTEEETI